jgi:AcrR family transcriptional regulator
VQPRTPAAAGERRTFIEAARRAQVVAAAIEAIADLGYPAASLARIAEYAGTSKGVVTYHFQDKEDLVRAVSTEVLARIGEYVGDQIAAETSGPGMLRAYISSNLAFMRDFRKHVMAISQIFWNARDEAGRPLYHGGALHVLTAPLESLLRRGQAAGEFRDFDAHAMTIAIRGAIDAVLPHLAHDPGLDLDRYALVLVEAFERATTPALSPSGR